MIIQPTILKGIFFFNSNLILYLKILFTERVLSEVFLDCEMPQLAVYSAAEMSFLSYLSSLFSFFIQSHLERPLIKSTPESLYKASL